VHDLKTLRDELPALREAMRRRGKLETLAPLLDRAERLERDRRSVIGESDDAKAQRARTAGSKRRRKAGASRRLIASTRELGTTSPPDEGV
jgi:seryl-tRNA synthetase